MSTQPHHQNFIARIRYPAIQQEHVSEKFDFLVWGQSVENCEVGFAVPHGNLDGAYKYGIDRLIGAANAFDLLPATDFGKATALPADIETLVAECENRVNDGATTSKTILEYKDRLLSTFGLIRGLNLRRKVVLRYATLPSELTKQLPEMDNMIVQSIRARNFFVHGTPTKFATEEELYVQLQAAGEAC